MGVPDCASLRTAADVTTFARMMHLARKYAFPTAEEGLLAIALANMTCTTCGVLYGLAIDLDIPPLRLACARFILDDPQSRELREQIAERKAEARLCEELGPLLGLQAI